MQFGRVGVVRAHDGALLAGLSGRKRVLAGEILDAGDISLERVGSIERWAIAADASIRCGWAPRGHDRIAFTREGGLVVSDSRTGDWKRVTLDEGECGAPPAARTPGGSGEPLSSPEIPRASVDTISAALAREGKTPRALAGSRNGTLLAVAASTTAAEARPSSNQPGSSLVVQGQTWDRAVRVWDIAKREVVFELFGNTAEVEAVSFSADGDRLATLASNGAVRVFPASLASLLKRAHELLASYRHSAAPAGH